MKREEAIKWVDDRMCWGRGTFTANHLPNIDECWEAGRMAIEALKEQEISNELQEYAYECGYEHFFHECQNCEYRRITNKAQDWIPCREGLPKTMGEYLVTVLSNPSKNPISSAAFYFTLKKEFGTFKSSGEWEKWDVIAWMPRPKPYKGGENE